MTGFTDTIEEIEQRQEQAPAEPGDHDRFSHYVEKNRLMEAMVTGTAVTALCGKQWVPTRDGLKFPVCPQCKAVWENLPPGQPEE